MESNDILESQPNTGHAAGVPVAGALEPKRIEDAFHDNGDQRVSRLARLRLKPATGKIIEGQQRHD
jgi:hypothetical protein